MLVEQLDRVGILPARIVTGKHAPDVTQARGAEDRIRHGVGDGVGVGVTGEALGIGDFYTAEDQLATRGEGV